METHCIRRAKRRRAVEDDAKKPKSSRVVVYKHTFDKLQTNKIYYINKLMLYLNKGRNLWCADCFKPTQGRSYHLTDHTVPVVKKAGSLFLAGDLSPDMFLIGVLPVWEITHHGSGSVEQYNKTKIRILYTIPESQLEYTLADLPDGESGWLMSWGVWMAGEGKWRVMNGYPVLLSNPNSSHGIKIKKIGGNRVHYGQRDI